jgi:hypothetical protein
VTPPDRCGLAHPHGWPVLARRDDWKDHTGLLPIIRSGIISRTFERLLDTRTPDRSGSGTPTLLWIRQGGLPMAEPDRSRTLCGWADRGWAGGG